LLRLRALRLTITIHVTALTIFAIAHLCPPESIWIARIIREKAGYKKAPQAHNWILLLSSRGSIICRTQKQEPPPVSFLPVADK
jgi:hypothetical protein